jgi:hypothetical protein
MNERYCLRKLGNLLVKLKVTKYDFRHISLYMKLKERLDKKKTLAELKSYEQKIKDHKIGQVK